MKAFRAHGLPRTAVLWWDDRGHVSLMENKCERHITCLRMTQLFHACDLKELKQFRRKDNMENLIKGVVNVVHGSSSYVLLFLFEFAYSLFHCLFTFYFLPTFSG